MTWRAPSAPERRARAASRRPTRNAFGLHSRRPAHQRIAGRSIDLPRVSLIVCPSLRMQIDSLKVFCDLAETESFTKSAHINGVTQSAVSQQITSLERHFKSLLIERSKKKFRLTQEGELLYDYSKRIVQTFEQLHFKIDELKNVISGSIRLATIYSIGLHELPGYMKRFLRAHPTVNVHVEYLRFNEVYEEIIGNAIDIGIVAFPNKDHRIETMNLHKDPMVLITSPAP